MPSFRFQETELYYEQAGRGPGMLLLHGLGNDVRIWEGLIPLLSQRFTVTALDLRGSGRSSKPDAPFTLKEMAADVAAILPVLGADPISILGFSMGGTIALELATSCAERIDRLVLVSTPPSWAGPFPPPEAIRKLFSNTVVTTELLAEVYELIFGSDFKQRHTVQEYIEFRLHDPMPQPLESYLHQLHALEGHPLNSKIDRIAVPTLVVTGAEDQVLPPKNSAWLAETIPGSKLELLPRVGHMVPLETPALLADSILK
ncbi:MAG: alpha/beta hydrolase [candidate division NC10 bacterium]|nr:alpha/beta hydrolase [candidate division NC10 bacterium]